MLDVTAWYWDGNVAILGTVSQYNEDGTVILLQGPVKGFYISHTVSVRRLRLKPIEVGLK